MAQEFGAVIAYTAAKKSKESTLSLLRCNQAPIAKLAILAASNVRLNGDWRQA
jgi:hypothetical protein